MTGFGRVRHRGEVRALPGGTTHTAYDALRGRVLAGPVALQLKGTASVPDNKAPSLLLEGQIVTEFDLPTRLLH